MCISLDDFAGKVTYREAELCYTVNGFTRTAVQSAGA